MFAQLSKVAILAHIYNRTPLIDSVPPWGNLHIQTTPSGKALFAVHTAMEILFLNCIFSKMLFGKCFKAIPVYTVTWGTTENDGGRARTLKQAVSKEGATR